MADVGGVGGNRGNASRGAGASKSSGKNATSASKSRASMMAETRANQQRTLDKKAERCLALDTGTVSDEASKKDASLNDSKPGLLDGLSSWAGGLFGGQDKAQEMTGDEKARACLQGVLQENMVQIGRQQGLSDRDILSMLESSNRQNSNSAPAPTARSLVDSIKP